MERKKQNLLPFIFLFLMLGVYEGGDVHDNLIKVYIDNSVGKFFVHEDNRMTSEPALNDVLNDEDAHQIRKWLPNALPTYSHGGLYLDRYYIIEFSDPRKNIQLLVDVFSEIPMIRSAETIPIIKVQDRPNDYYWDELYGLRQINADNAYLLWDFQNGEIPGVIPDGEIIVGVVDLGLMWDHPDLIGNTWRNLGEDADGDGVVLEFIDDEWVFDPGDTNSVDDDGDGYIDNFVGYDVAYGNNDPSPTNTSMAHGTMVAGCVSGMTNNEIGIASVGWSVKLMGVNSGQNSSTISHGYEGLLAAAQMGADIINLSWGMTSWVESHEVFINFIHEEFDCILVAAAGNDGVYEPHYPASYDNVISVTATAQGDQFPCWPNFHETVDISAPGQQIWTTIPFSTSDQTMYEDVIGTSFSSPTVAGALALLKTVFPNGDPEMLVSRILNSASYFDDMDESCNGQSLEGLLGEGQLNMHDALIMEPAIELTTSNLDVISSTGLGIPGDTNMVSIFMYNLPGSAPIDNIVMQLTTDDPNIEIIDDVFAYDGIVPSGHEFESTFMIASNDMASFGDLPFSINLSADVSGNFPTGLNFDPHGGEFDVLIPFGFEQDGYPINNVSVDGVPLFTDLYGNSSLSQIFFNSDSLIIGKWISGQDVLGFPFNVGSRVTTSVSAGDLDGDGDKELVFGAENGDLHVVAKDGSSSMVFSQPDPIIGYPTLFAIDGSNELTIAFVSANDSTSSLHVIDNSGQYLNGFPVELQGMVNHGASIADMDLDGVSDILVVMQSGILHAFGHDGNIKPNFPMSFNSEISTPVTIADMDGDMDMEMMLGSNDGNIHVLHHDGSVMSNFYIEGASVDGGLSVGDLDQDGSMEVIFNTSDHHVHAWEPQNDNEIDGWPVNIGVRSITEPLLVDLNNDLRLELINVAINGFMNVIKHDGDNYDNFPYQSNDSIQFSPAIGDLDGDGDHEIFIGSGNSLKVLDILDESGSQYSWSSYRGNNHRDGVYDVTQSYMHLDKDLTPAEFGLEYNYPNPFNPSTRIKFSIPSDMNISINVYDVMGRQVKTILSGSHAAGRYSVIWNGSDQHGRSVSSGIYFYELKGADDLVDTRKMILIK